MRAEHKTEGFVLKWPKVRIVPRGDQAAYLVGLTRFQLTTSTYITDGASRKIHLSNGRSIELQHTSEMRLFAFKNP